MNDLYFRTDAGDVDSANEQHPGVWVFRNSGAAYSACQMCEELTNGSTLVCEDDKVIGLAWTWPVAVTIVPGELHTLRDAPGALVRTMQDARWTPEQLRVAVAEARARGWAIAPMFEQIPDSVPPRVNGADQLLPGETGEL